MHRLLSDEAIFAAAVRKELQLPTKVDLHSLAEALRLRIFEVESKTFEGALLRSAHSVSGRILLRRGIREPGRRRFTIAHEIGHYFLNGDSRIPCSPRMIEGWREGQPEPERQADAFASELLLPTEEVVSTIGGRWPSLDVVSEVGEKFGSSMMAAARKFCDVAEQPCAVVWSSKGQIRWFHPSSSFSYFVPVGQAVRCDSVASHAFDGRGVSNEMQEVPAESWINSYYLRDDAMVSEQSLAMPFYDGCLSLVWVRRLIEDKPNEDDALLAELDPDEFTLRRPKWPR